MTNKEKRVALAKDVLAQLRAGKLVPDTGAYCIPGDDGKRCVCALGALVVACCNPEHDVDSAGEAIACLVPTFSRAQVALIEAAFEQYDSPSTARDVRVSAKAIKAAAAMYPSTKYRQMRETHEHFIERHAVASKRRLRAIMHNIIDNDGTFVVEA